MIKEYQNKASIFLLTGFLITGSFLPIHKAGAQELENALKGVAEKLEEIEVIEQNKELSIEEREQLETKARKEALYQIFDLTLLEDQDLKDRLSSLENLNEEQEKIRESLLKIFTENENAYEEMKKRLESAETLGDVKQLATDFKNWRKMVYDPKVKKIIAFTLVFRQKAILTITQSRFAKITSDLKKLENTKLISAQDTAEYLKKASDHIKKAEELNRQALKSVKLSEEKEFEEEEGEKPEARELIEESLNNIKSAYQNFIEISGIVRKKLGMK
jgi:hypothetical protein